MTYDVVSAALAAAPAVGLDGLGTADLQQRVDRKYLVAVDQLDRLADRLCATHTLLTVDGLQAFSYRSRYFDTPELTCFRAHRQGRRLRWKLRNRLYEDSGLCRFEIKLKTGRGDTDKHALVIPAGETEAIPAEGRLLLNRLLAERYGAAAPLSLLPSLTVLHRRSTLVARDGSGRVTFDSAVSFVGPHGTAQLADGLVLVETKSRDGRSAADRLLHESGIRPVAVSKYCAGIALTHAGQPDQPWRPLLTKHFSACASLGLAA